MLRPHVDLGCKNDGEMKETVFGGFHKRIPKLAEWLISMGKSQEKMDDLDVQ